jgi:hypothetical protein
MPITNYLNGRYVDPETRRVMGVAFEMARSALRLPDRDDAIIALIAEKIIQLAEAGERNPDLLCENALNDLQAIVKAQAVVKADVGTPASGQPHGR